MSDEPNPDLRRHVGLLAVPPVVAWLLLGPLPGALTGEMRAVAALAAAMAILWVSEALPLAATALLPLVVLPAAGVATASQAAGAFANDLVFLFLGGFVLANGVERAGVHRRLALAVRRLVGTSQPALVGGMMAATAFVSLWISNTAAALLMMPVALAVAGPGGPAAAPFRAAMAIGVALAASIGGMGTPIGSTPNLLLVSTMAEVHHVRLGFGWWLAWGLPLVGVLTAAAWALLVGVFHPLRGERVTEPEPAAAPGPWSPDERLVVLAFGGAIAAWIAREPLLGAWLPGLTDGMIAIAAALVLFAVPLAWRPLRFALDWETGGKLPWDVILLLGGGLSLAEGIARTGLDRVLVQGLGGAADLPAWALALGLMVAGLLLSEVASNTAAAALLLPIAGALAAARGLDPLALMLPVTMAASLGFVLPAATPPNALALGTGHVRPGELARVGAAMDLLGLAAILAACYGLAFPLLGR